MNLIPHCGLDLTWCRRKSLGLYKNIMLYDRTPSNWCTISCLRKESYMKVYFKDENFLDGFGSFVRWHHRVNTWQTRCQKCKKRVSLLDHANLRIENILINDLCVFAGVWRKSCVYNFSVWYPFLHSVEPQCTLSSRWRREGINKFSLD